MEKLPTKGNLAQETCQVLKDWILRGILSENLPGELTLKRRLCVGRDTLRQALKLLTEDGWISEATKGKPRLIQVRQASLPAPEPEADESPLPIAFISPFRVEPRVTFVEFEETLQHLASKGRRMLFFSPDVFHLAQPGHHLERLVQSTPAAAWILHATSEPMQRWFDQSGLPAFLYEMPYPGVKLPYVACDWGAAAFHAGLQLLRQGHRTIGILEYTERRPGLVADEEGLKQALATVKEDARLMVFHDDLTPAGVARSLDAALKARPRPTALILTRSSQVATCYSWLANRGISIPGDISLISLPNDTWFCDLYPPICYYNPDTGFMSRKIAERMLELIDTGHITHKSILCPLNFSAGGSIGPAPTKAS
jgi:DNA-binding LacI/PurR family transcriptional regulator